MNFSLNGKRVLVTGAGQGLGRDIVQNFVDNGASVFGLDVNGELLKNLKESFPTVTIVQVDLSKWEETKKVVESLGPLDVLVNNAGAFVYQPILETTEEALDKVMHVNFKAALNLSLVFARNVITNGIKGASIVNVSSAGGKTPGPSTTVYSCSKAALNMMTMSLACEFACHGIRVNAVAPGTMPTSMLATIAPEMIKSLEPLFHRALVPGLIDLRDVSTMVLYLCSPLTKAVTGSIFPIDGGFTFAGSRP